MLPGNETSQFDLPEHGPRPRKREKSGNQLYDLGKIFACVKVKKQESKHC